MKVMPGVRLSDFLAMGTRGQRVLDGATAAASGMPRRV